MGNQVETGAQRPLNRPGYAVAFGGCIAGLVGYGMIMGAALASTMAADPFAAMEQMFAWSIVGNVLVGILFTYFTYRRALDCEFGQNGKAWIAVLAALPTLALPQYGLLVFTAMMFIKSAAAEESTSGISDDEGLLRPLEPGE